MSRNTSVVDRYDRVADSTTEIELPTIADLEVLEGVRHEPERVHVTATANPDAYNLELVDVALGVIDLAFDPEQSPVITDSAGEAITDIEVDFRNCIGKFGGIIDFRAGEDAGASLAAYIPTFVGVGE